MKLTKKTIVKRVGIPVLALFLLATASSFRSDFFEIAKQIEIFTTLFKELNMNYVDETNPAELMDSAIKNMLDELDPYTKFLNEQDVEAYKIKNAGEYSGIGALVRSYEDKLLIIEPYKDYPADKAGLKAGDEIIKIGDIQISDFKDDASELLKGANKTEVAVTFKRQNETKTATIKREGIEVDAVPFFGMVDNKTGYIVLSKFNAKASSQTEAAMRELKEKGAEQLILDLRNNPGGLLSEAINVTNLFIPKDELVVTTKSKVKKFNREYKTRNQPVDADIPLVVLVNGGSASASEIVSGSLQDLDRAVIMGARSFGKGLVQRPLRLTYGTQLKVTISRYYTASGRCIQALDYRNRDARGNAVRNTDFSNFTTRNGRTVQDGGGVMPDVEIPILRSNDLIKALQDGLALFNYATDYYYDNSIASIEEFELTDADYEAFKSHVFKSDFSFDLAIEKRLERAMADDTGGMFDQGVMAAYESFSDAIQNSKRAALDTYKSELTKSLEDEIIKRYFYRDGLFSYYLQNDDAIQEASRLLADGNAYANILK